MARSVIQHSFYSPSLISIHFTKVDANSVSSVFVVIHAGRIAVVQHLLVEFPKRASFLTNASRVPLAHVPQQTIILLAAN
jgi:hypothetical protein